VEELLLSPYLLAPVFFLVALAYASVGLGGGSSYTALLAIFGASYLVIPTISLTLNLLVTTIGSFNFIRKRHARFALIAPFFITSIPMTYLGGSLQVSKELFQWVLWLSLVVVALRIYLWKQTSLQLKLNQTQKIALSLAAGAVLGLIAGVAGIGGGIYLVPLIIILGLGTAREAAACGALFVWVNSLTGIVARVQYNPAELTPFIPVVVAVVVGGVWGSHLGSSRLQPKMMERVLGGIVVAAILLLGRKLLLQ